MLVCDKCGAGINQGSKFCPQCGDPVTDEDRVTTPIIESQIANVKISFGQSSSPNFNKAVEICKNIPSYSVIGEGKQSQHNLTLPITEVDLIINLYDLVGSWKSSQMLINGHAATKKDLTYYGVGCYRTRQKSYKPEQFCFGEKEYEANIWGCKRLNMPIYEWDGGWLNYGKYDKSRIWHVDKDRIRHELEIMLKENKLCPVLDRKKVLETLEKFPNSINPQRDSNWQYTTDYEEVNGDYKKINVGIKPAINKINRYIIGDFKPIWGNEEEHQSNNEHIIKVNRQFENEIPKKKMPAKEESNLSSIFLWICVVLILYGLIWVSF